MNFRLVLALILLMTAACTSDKAPRYAHTAEQSPTTADVDGEVVASAAAGGDVLDSRTLGDRSVTGTVDFRRRLHQYNLLLLRKAKSSPAAALSELKRYEKQLLAGCDSQLQGCIHFRIFRSSPLSAVIAQQIAKSKAGVQDYYRLLMAAYEIKNATYDHDLVLLYLKRAQEYADHLNGKKQPELLQRHGRVLTTMLIDFQGRAKPAEVAVVLEQFKIWNFSRTQAGLLGSSNTILFNLAAKGYLYVDGKLNPALVKMIAESQAAEDSFSKKLERLALKSPYLVQGAEIGQLPAKDEYFYMVDRLFGGHLALDDAAALWEASNKDSQKLAKFLKAVLYTELLTTVSTANRGMRDFFARSHDLPTKKLLAETLNKSMELIPLFQSLLARAKIVRDFTGRTLHNVRDQQLYREVSTQYDSLDNNIKFMATYPQMMMLAYHLSKAKFEMTIRMFFFSITLDSATILQQIIGGVYGPWFGYSNDQKPISSMDILYSLYFAFQLDSFSDFKIDPADFLLTVAQKMTGKDTETMRLHHEHIRDTLLRSAQYREFIRLCRQAKTTGKIDLPLSLEDFLERPLVGGKLYERMFNVGGGLSVVGNFGGFNIGKLEHGFFLGSNLTARSFEEIRTDLNPVLFRLRGMAAAYRTVMRQKGVNENEINSKMKPVDGFFDRVDQLKYNVVSSFMEGFRDNNCIFLLNRMDRDRRNNLMKMELEHLRQVHRAMTKLQSAGGQQDELNASLRTDTRRLGVAPADHFDRERFVYNRLDFIARATENLMKSEPHARINFPQSFRASMSGGLAAKLSMPLSAIINYHPDEETFVTRAFKTHFDPNADNGEGAKKRWTAWFKYNGAEPYNFKYERSIVGTLHRMGPIKAPNGKVADYITADDLVKTVEAEARFVYQNDSDRMFWEKLNVFHVYGLEYMVDLFISHRDAEPLPVFQHMFDMLVSDDLGDKYLPASEANKQSEQAPGTATQIAWTELGKQYVLSRQYRANFIVPVDPRFDQLLDQDIRAEVGRDRRAPFDFARAIRDREQADTAENRIQIMYYANQPARDVEYLAQIQVQDFEARLREFHKITGGFFEVKSTTSP